jgi:hypothetical protein
MLNKLLNKYKIFKGCRCCQILRFIFKNYHNFESYQSMLITLGFCIIKHKFLLYVMHITPQLHVVNDFWKFKNLKYILNF